MRCCASPGAFRANQTVADRVMDSMDLEREKGITILAKNTAVRYTTEGGDEVKINIVDTPGHAVFGGEVERALTMVDGVLLLVDASEGPLPQTRFVLRKALELQLPVVLVINKIDRPDARIEAVVDETYELFLDLDAGDDQIDFPIVYTNAREGHASTELGTPRRRPAPALRRGDRDDPASPPRSRPSAPGLGHQPRRQPLCRPFGDVSTDARDDPAGSDRRAVAPRRDPRDRQGRRALRSRRTWSEWRPSRRARARSSRCRASANITIGETLTDVDDPRPLPVITVDEPSLAMTIGVNTSPLAGKDGKSLTARLIKNRLDAGARRQRVVAGARHGSTRHMGSAGPRGTPARGACGDDAP